MTWRSEASLPLSPAELWRVHQIHAELGAAGCCGWVTDLYEVCTCGVQKLLFMTACVSCLSQVDV